MVGRARCEKSRVARTRACRIAFTAAAMPLDQAKIEAAKRKAQEMKAAAAAKRAAKEAQVAAAGAPPPAQTSAALFDVGERNVVLVDWDDTLFPTSAWKNRLDGDAAHPLRESKVAELSTAITTLITTLQKFGDVKIVTHGVKGWYEKSSQALAPGAKAVLDALPARYRDSYGQKYMHKKAGKYTTVIGTECDNYGEWYKTDMFFEFISEQKQPRKWDETHLPEKVTLPQQVLVIGDGSAEKRSYDELGNQRDLYAKRPGHAPVAQVGLKGVFLKAEPSSDELIVQLKWMAANVEQFLQKATASQTKVWDLTKFPEWACLEKVGANAYSTLSKGSLGADAVAASAARGSASTAAAQAAAAQQQEELELQAALAASLQTQ